MIRMDLRQAIANYNCAGEAIGGGLAAPHSLPAPAPTLPKYLAYIQALGPALQIAQGSVQAALAANDVPGLTAALTDPNFGIFTVAAVVPTWTNAIASAVDAQAPKIDDYAAIVSNTATYLDGIKSQFAAGATPIAQVANSAVTGFATLVQGAQQTAAAALASALATVVTSKGCPTDAALVTAFQNAYNAASFSKTVAVTGEYDSATQAALDEVLPGKAPAACVAGPPPSPAPGPGLPPLPAPPPAPGVKPPPAPGGNSISTSSNTGMIVLGVLALGAAGTAVYFATRPRGARSTMKS